MKYMGSKRVMLQNGLGTLILEESKKATRIVDLFCGAGAVVRFASEKTNLPVLAIDLQQYSVVLAKAILGRVSSVAPESLEKKWLSNVETNRIKSVYWDRAQQLSSDLDMRATKEYVEKCRRLCKKASGVGPVWNAYGGYYFSPEQALTFDHMLKNLPSDSTEKTICQAAIIITATRCVASPGHTAQPFQPTKTARKFLIEAWTRDPLVVCKKVLNEVCSQHAKTLGKSYVSDAVKEASKLKETDLVIVDPPYSGVQYSRFYHVLETLAKGNCGVVTGVGRYPAIKERPQSDFSNAGQSKEALVKLLSNLSKSGATAIFTFPEGECSNGLSGDMILKEAKKNFKIEKKIVKGKFSTLGGNNKLRALDGKKEKRASRLDCSELILLMKAK